MKLTRGMKPIDRYCVLALLAATPLYHVHQLWTWVGVALISAGYVGAGRPFFGEAR